MNLLLVIVDSLRYDYAERCGLFNVMKPAHIFKCHVHGECTAISLPQILTGKEKADTKVVGEEETRNGKMWLTRIEESTMFDYFKENGFSTQYINIDREDELYQGNKRSFFPSLPSGRNLATASIFTPFCIALHIWDVHYPHPKGYEAHVRDFIERRVKRLKSVKDTLIVMMADHGELLGEEGRWRHGPPMTKELREVPLIIYPAPEHVIHERTVESTQVLPMILDIFGLKHSLQGSVIGELV